MNERGRRQMENGGTSATVGSRRVHAFTVDLEEWYHGIELPEEQWPTESRLRIGLDRLLRLLDDHGTKATFFVLGVVADRFPGLIGELARAGHEIACHGHRHTFIYRQTPAQFRQDVRQALESVGAASGGPPRGFRAPYFSVRKNSLWALDILAEEGFAYDSSVFPVRNDRYGIPGAPREPYDLIGAGRTMREVPITPIRVLGLNVPFSGGAYLRLLPWWSQALAWHVMDSAGSSVVAYIHPWELDPDQPRIPLPRRIAATHYPRLRLTEPRLERLLTRYPFGRLDHVLGMT